MAEEEVIIIDDMDDDDYWMEMERERREQAEASEEDSYDESPDPRFRFNEVEKLLQTEREQLSKKNLETSVVQFIRHQELGLKKPRTNLLKRFLLSREICTREFSKYDVCLCDEEDPIHSRVKCRGNSLRFKLELIQSIEKMREDSREEMLRQDLEKLKSLREDKQICTFKPVSKYTLRVLTTDENGKFCLVPPLDVTPGASSLSLPRATSP